MPFCLNNLLEPISAHEFLNRYWSKQPFVNEIPASNLPKVLEGLRFGSVAELLADSASQTTRLWFTTRDGVGETVVPIKDALTYYAAGMTLFFDRRDPTVSSWFTRLEDDLLIPHAQAGKAGSVASIFASASGHGSSIHFDRFELLTVQLLGEKTWWIAEPALEAVTDNFRPGDEYFESFDAYRFDRFAHPRREQMRKIVLKPGGVLYIPRGSWHETEASAEADSASLNFAFGPPTRWDILAPAIRRAAQSDRRWREWAANGTEDIQRELLLDLSAHLKAAAQGIRPMHAASHFVRNRSASLCLLDESSAGGHVALYEDTFESRRKVTLDAATVSVARHFSRQPGCADLQAVQLAHPELNRTEIEASMASLVALGYLRVAAP